MIRQIWFRVCRALIYPIFPVIRLVVGKKGVDKKSVDKKSIVAESLETSGLGLHQASGRVLLGESVTDSRREG